MKTAFFSVIYPAAEPFLNDFFGSLERQTDHGFDLFLINDGVEEPEPYLAGRENLAPVFLDYSGTPAQLRQFGIRALWRRGYEAVVLGDCDDWFRPDRVAVLKTLLRDSPIAVNELDLVDLDGEPLESGYLARRIEEGRVVRAGDIQDGNFMGLSNTALGGEALEMAASLDLDPDLVAIDWFMFGMLLHQGLQAVFTGRTGTFYRQHPKNSVGMSRLTEEKARQGLEIKARHYCLMARAHKLYQNQCRRFSRMNETARNPEWLEAYLDFLESHRMEHPFWWEDIRPLED